MYLGIDLGTGSCKVGVLNRQGRLLAFSSERYELNHPREGWAEIDPAVWLTCVDKAVSRLPHQLRSEVISIGLSGQMHGLVVLDQSGKSLRPAMLWPDVRVAHELNEYAKIIGPSLNPPSAGMFGPMLWWLCRQEAGLAARIHRAVLPKDWLRFRLCGEYSTDPSDCSGTLLCDDFGHWDLAACARLGFDPRWLSPVSTDVTRGAEIDSYWSSRWGLPKGCRVAIGAADTACAAYGNGLQDPELAQMTIGTGAQIIVLTQDQPKPSSSLNAYRAAGLHNTAPWYQMAAMLNAGSVLEWVRRFMSVDWADFYREAFAVADDLSALPWFMPWLYGERTPFMCPVPCAGWAACRPEHQRGHLLLAALIGTAMGFRLGLEALREQGHQIDRLLLAGGGSTDVRWRQILADVLGVALVVSPQEHAALVGAAALGSEVTEYPVRPEPSSSFRDLVLIEPSREISPEQLQQFRSLHRA